jgi:hypothetical protein
MLKILPSKNFLNQLQIAHEVYAGNETEVVMAAFNSCEIQIAVGKSGRQS